MPIIRVDLLEGRDAGTKRELIGRLTDVTAEVLGVSREQVRVLITELPPRHWGTGGVPIDERKTFEP